MSKYVGKYFKRIMQFNETQTKRQRQYCYVLKERGLFDTVMVEIRTKDEKIIYASIDKTGEIWSKDFIQIDEAEFDAAQFEALNYLDGLRGKSDSKITNADISGKEDDWEDTISAYRP